MPSCLRWFLHIAISAALVHGFPSSCFLVVAGHIFLGLICDQCVQQSSALQDSRASELPSTVLIQFGLHGIPCLQVVSLRVWALPRGDSLRRPSRHLAGLFHMLLLDSRHFRSVQNLCASMCFQSVVIAHVPRSGCMFQGSPFSPRRSVGATPVWPHIGACLNIRTGLWVTTNTQGLRIHCYFTVCSLYVCCWLPCRRMSLLSTAIPFECHNTPIYELVFDVCFGREECG